MPNDPAMPSLMTQKLQALATWSAIALGFAIPISTAASNTLLGLTLVFFMLSGGYRAKLQAIVSNPLALATLAFCAAVLLGCAYGLGSMADKKHYLVKYLSLLAIPLLVPLFATQRHRVYALAAFCAAMLLTLLISLLLWLDWLSWLPPELIAAIGEARDPEYPITHNAVVFKLSITHGFLMAIAAYLLMLAARHAVSVGLRRVAWLCGALAALAAANVLFMIIGRTGYVVLAVLGCYFFASRFGKRGMLLAIVAMTVVGAAVYQWSGTFHSRADKAIAEASSWQQGKGDKTSIGLRFDYYTNALGIIREHPLLGVGTGGFAAAYDERVKDTAMARSNNPHNQYLLITAQLGVFGLALLLGLYAIYWRQAGRLTPPFQQIARGVLLAFLVGNLFNSFMLDFSERMFFAWISGVLLAELSARSPKDA